MSLFGSDWSKSVYVKRWSPTSAVLCLAGMSVEDLAAVATADGWRTLGTMKTGLNCWLVMSVWNSKC